MPGIFHTVTLEEVAHWPRPDYDHPSAERTWLAPFSIAWCVVSTAMVWLRLFLRARNRSGPFGWDDVLIFISWAFSLAFTITACISVWDVGIGRHVWDLRPDNFRTGLYFGWVAQILFIHSTCAAKTSVLLFYHRMIKNTYGKAWLYTVWVLLFITIGSWIGIFVAYLFMCQPLHIFWDIYFDMAKGQTEFKCIDGDALTIAVGVLTIASDFWTAALPCTLFQYHDLGVSRKQKVALNIIFCLGFIVTGVGIARTYYLWHIAHDVDISWIGYDLFTVSTVELQLTLICTCAPFLRALFRTYGGRVSVMLSRSNDTGTADRSRNRVSVRMSGVRGSFVPITPLDRSDSPMATAEEKSGTLVREETTGRLVWSPSEPASAYHSPTKGLYSPTSVMFPTEPLDPV